MDTKYGKALHDDTVAIHTGRRPHAHYGVVNPPVYHASTILHETVDSWENRSPRRYTEDERGAMYGRVGTPTLFPLEEAITALEGGADTVLTPSGLGANTLGILSFVEKGGHILVPDSVYFPVRKFCDGVLARIGIETEYYDPHIGAGIDALIRANTNLIWLESPGSLTFEIQDLPAITAVAKARGVPTAIDNTWGAGYYLKPLLLGVDVSTQAATKYIVGHSDAMAGTVTANATHAERVRSTWMGLGNTLGPDDAYLAQRGLRTLGTRMPRHYENGVRIARWLEARPEVARVIHPALESHPGHAIWKRDFTGACGLFGFILKPSERAQIVSMMEGLQLFGMGASWGGYESLMTTSNVTKARSVSPWQEPGQLMRIHIGLENADDLIADLEAGFERLAG